MAQMVQLQQYLPFTVLKPVSTNSPRYSASSSVTTVLTVYGIETDFPEVLKRELGMIVTTVLTVYGIETGGT